MTEEELLLERARESLLAARIMLRENLPNIAASRAYYAMFYVEEFIQAAQDYLGLEGQI